VLPAQIGTSAPEQLLKARGSFRLWTGVLTAKAGGVAVVALALGLTAERGLTAARIGAAIALVVLISAALEVSVLAGRLGFSSIRFWRNVAAVWLPQTAIGLIVAAILTSSGMNSVAALAIAALSAAVAGAVTASAAVRLGLLKASPSQTA
jgi:hypothetical protein